MIRLSKLFVPLVVCAILGLVGCASTGDGRVAFVSTAETVGIIQLAVAQKYANCHAEADNRTEQNACFMTKNREAAKLDTAIEALDAYGRVLVEVGNLPPDDNLALARLILSELRIELSEYIAPEQGQALAWLEGGGQ